jgi:hypothetical protein
LAIAAVAGGTECITVAYSAIYGAGLLFYRFILLSKYLTQSELEPSSKNPFTQKQSGVVFLYWPAQVSQ